MFWSFVDPQGYGPDAETISLDAKDITTSYLNPAPLNICNNYFLSNVVGSNMGKSIPKIETNA